MKKFWLESPAPAMKYVYLTVCLVAFGCGQRSGGSKGVNQDPAAGRGKTSPERLVFPPHARPAIAFPALKGGKDDSEELMAFFRGFDGEPTLALEWLLKIQDTVEGHAGLVGLGQKIGGSNSQLVGSLAARITNLTARENFLNASASAWGHNDSRAASAWVLKNRGLFISDELAYTCAARVLAENSNYEEASEVVDKMVPPMDPGVPLMRLAASWGVASPSSFAEWLDKSSNPEVQNQGVYQLASLWATADRDSALRWAESQTDQILRDQAFSGLVQSFQRFDPENSWKYLCKITDSSKQAEQAEQLIRHNPAQLGHIREWLGNGASIPTAVEDVLKKYHL